jgi:hypothetical protein
MINMHIYMAELAYIAELAELAELADMPRKPISCLPCLPCLHSATHCGVGRHAKKGPNLLRNVETHRVTGIFRKE